MARYYWNKKTTVEDCKKMDVFFLRKYGYFNHYRRGTMRWLRGGEENGSVSLTGVNGEYLRVCYTQTDRDTEEKREKDYRIGLAKTPCHLGGSRHWFLCNFCERRVGKLYLHGKNEFACRHCLNLSYDIRNAGGIEKRLGKITSASDLDEMNSKIRIRYYRGRPTKRYQKFINKSEKFNKALLFLSKSLA